MYISLLDSSIWVHNAKTDFSAIPLFCSGSWVHDIIFLPRVLLTKSDKNCLINSTVTCETTVHRLMNFRTRIDGSNKESKFACLVKRSLMFKANLLSSFVILRGP